MGYCCKLLINMQYKVNDFFYKFQCFLICSKNININGTYYLLMITDAPNAEVSVLSTMP